MRVTRKESLGLFILQILADNEGLELSGLEIVEQSEGELERHNIYNHLGHLEELKYIESHKEDVIDGTKRLPRRLYKITESGGNLLNTYFMADPTHTANNEL